MAISSSSYVLALACACIAAQAADAGDYLKAFPAAEKGMVRHVLILPADEHEENMKLELVVGKTVQLEPANRYFFGGRIETKTARGWGFSYYVLPNLGPMGGTLMAVDPNAPKIDRFIQVGGESPLLRYNSKVPVVVYVPSGVEVRYRIWRAAPEMSKVGEG